MSKKLDKQQLLLSYLDEMVQKLRSLVPTAILDGDESAIHHARVATRRLDAAVEVFESICSKVARKDFIRILSKLRKSLGRARDVDVMLGHLQNLKLPRLQPAVDWMTQQLKNKQQKLRQNTAKKLDVAKTVSRLAAWWNLRQEWSESKTGVTHLITRSLHLQLAVFVEHANAVGHVNRITADGALMDPHELRIAGKALRYTLEMAVVGYRLPVRITRSFKRMQDALGLWHDNVVLAECAMQLSLKNALGYHDAQLQRLVLELAKTVVLNAERELAKFNRLWKASSQSLPDTIRRAFPLEIPAEPSTATQTKKDPDLFDFGSSEALGVEAPQPSHQPSKRGTLGV